MSDAFEGGDATVDAATGHVIRQRGPQDDTFGRYRLLDKLGEGGMAVVYRAHDPDLDRDVALKLVRPDPRSPLMRADRLLNEARALAELSHPNIVEVFDVGMQGETVYMSMRLIPGPTLRSWLRDTKRDWRSVLRVFTQAARALQAAHDRGLVHRDFKPANVILDKGEVARVVDFGLVAPDEERSAGGELDTAEVSGGHSTSKQRTMGALGTPVYMAPEQQLGEVDPRSDQFAFCVALYEGLYGRVPFDGASIADLMASKERGLPSPPGSDVPRWLFAILRKGTSFDAANRYPSMDALLEACERGQRRRSQVLFASVGAGLLAVAAAAAVPLMRSGDREPVIVRSEVAPDTPVDPELAATLEKVEFSLGLDSQVWARRQLDEIEPKTMKPGAQRYRAHWLLIDGRLARREGNLEGSDASLRDAHALALEAGADEIAAKAAVGLIAVHVADQEEVRHWNRAAESALRHVEDPRQIEARRLLTLSMSHAVRRETERALELSRRSWDIARVAFEETDPRRLQIAHFLAAMLVRAHQHREAAALVRTTLQQAQDTLGERHRITAMLRDTLGKTHFELGRYEEAEAEWKRALEALDPVHGADGRSAASVRLNLGLVGLRLGHFDEALAQFQAIGDAFSDQPMNDVAIRIAEIEAYEMLEDFDTMRQRASSLRVFAEDRLGPESPYVAASLSMEANALLHLRQPAEAAPLVGRAVEIDEATPLPARMRIYLLSVRGILLRDQRRHVAAIAVFEEVLALHRDSESEEFSRYQIEYEYGRALYEAGQQTRGLERVADARASLEAFGDGGRIYRAWIDAWYEQIGFTP